MRSTISANLTCREVKFYTASFTRFRVTSFLFQLMVSLVLVHIHFFYMHINIQNDIVYAPCVCNCRNLFYSFHTSFSGHFPHISSSLFSAPSLSHDKIFESESSFCALITRSALSLNLQYSSQKYAFCSSVIFYQLSLKNMHKFQLRFCSLFI